ncbi:hypothetical protein ACH5RR_018420 [Cinchona calisaya]|uniref:Protein FAR1-RELATED SEQUENCE n=1 Tax=Cinchona calisaya TaxID=153742 RepID=A0ABD2ZN26_9GENT
MEFDTEAVAKEYYEAYAKVAGLGARLSKAHTDQNSWMLLDRVFCSSRERKRHKDKCNVNVKCPRPETRCECAGRMKISCRQNGKYHMVKKDDLITNIFCDEAKMRTDYANFGDVVCFDTTYRKHKDGRPIALFVSINHHKQTLVFGAALLHVETVKTFEWLFDTFARTVIGKTPCTMLTDQDGRMTTLDSQWPTINHRLYIWHIYQNAAILLTVVFANISDFATDLVVAYMIIKAKLIFLRDGMKCS